MTSNNFSLAVIMQKYQKSLRTVTLHYYLIAILETKYFIHKFFVLNSLFCVIEFWIKLQLSHHLETHVGLEST